MCARPDGLETTEREGGRERDTRARLLASHSCLIRQKV